MAAPTFTLEVPISCCSQCPLRAKEKLQKIQGVDSITIDAAKDLVVVSGSVEPSVILEKFAKWGKKAEVLSFRKEPLDSDDSDDNDDFCNSDSGPVNKQAKKSGNCCWLGIKIFGNKRRDEVPAANRTVPAGNKWQFPRARMNEFGSLKPFNGSQSHQSMIYGRPLVPPHPGYMPRPPMLPQRGVMQPWPPMLPQHGAMQPRPPMLPQHGAMQPGPIRSQLINPMIHYTSYEDNYRYW